MDAFSRLSDTVCYSKHPEQFVGIQILHISTLQLGKIEPGRRCWKHRVVKARWVYIPHYNEKIYSDALARPAHRLAKDVAAFSASGSILE